MVKLDSGYLPRKPCRLTFSLLIFFHSCTFSPASNIFLVHLVNGNDYDKENVALPRAGRRAGRPFAVPQQRLVCPGYYSNLSPLPAGPRRVAAPKTSR